MNNPFQPVSFAPGPPTQPAWEAGPTKYAPYNGQNQTAHINVAQPAPPMESGPTFAPGPAPVPTLGVGNIVTIPAGGVPAQARMFLQGGQLYILDNNGTAYVVPASANVPQPAIYSPTK